MSDENAGQLFKACFDYCEGFTDAEVADCIKEVWAELKSYFEEEARCYEEKCAKYKANIRKRWKPNDTMVLQSYYNGINKETESEKEKVAQKEKGKEEEKIIKEKIDKRKDEKERSEVQQLTLLPEAQEKARKAKGKQRKAFVPPSVEEVVAYCAERGYRDVDAEQFCAYYGSIGWKVGKHDMKDWKLAVVTWQRNAIQRQKEREQRRGFGTSVGERAYNMLHFEYEGHPEKWLEEEKKIQELQKDI